MISTLITFSLLVLAGPASHASNWPPVPPVQPPKPVTAAPVVAAPVAAAPAPAEPATFDIEGAKSCTNDIGLAEQKMHEKFANDLFQAGAIVQNQDETKYGQFSFKLTSVNQKTRISLFRSGKPLGNFPLVLCNSKMGGLVAALDFSNGQGGAGAASYIAMLKTAQSISGIPNDYWYLNISGSGTHRGQYWVTDHTLLFGSQGSHFSVGAAQ